MLTHQYGSVAQRQEASDSKSLQGVFESLQIHQRFFVRVALLASIKTGNSGCLERQTSICPFEHELASALAIVSRIPFNDSEGTLKLLRNREYVGSSPTMGNWVAAIQRVGGVRFPKGLRSTRGLIGSKLSHWCSEATHKSSILCREQSVRRR